LFRKQVSIIVNCGRAGADQAIGGCNFSRCRFAVWSGGVATLLRIRKSEIKLVVWVDTIAGSGGYMMASVGDQIYAAPLADIGSIGVVTHVPIFSQVSR
jgi:enoyl-CoA hydratase/carnithine racemase